MKTKALILLLIVTAFTSCIPLSLRPLCTEKDIVFDPNLVGKWTEPNETEGFWEFTAGKDQKSYTFRFKEKDKYQKGAFTAHLVRIDDMLFLDLFPNDPNLQTDSFYDLHLLPVHSFVKVEQIIPTFEFSHFDYEKLTKLLEKDPNVIKHEFLEERDDWLLLTDSTEQLQQFMRKYAKDLFQKPEELKPIKPESKADPNTPETKDANDTQP
jgi:hypothetical protein